MLKAFNLKKTYKPKKGQEVHALDDVSIEFEEKGLVFILGKSGSGKSTLLNVLGGLDTYDEGVIEVKGKSSKDFSQADFDSYRNTFIGFIFQDYNVLDGYSVEKNIGLALELQGKKADKERIEELIKQVDLEGLGKRKPNTLSGGQKQRVAIARALVKNPEIIMADEPTGALDSNTGKQVFDTLKKLSKEKLVIVVSHDREFAEIYGDRVVELADGKIISDIYKYKSEPKKSDGFEIVDDKILTIKKGTKLDAEKLDKLNEFLSSKDEDIIISTDLDANKKFKAFAKIDDEGNKESFKDTTKEDLDIKDYDPKDFKLIRSKLPFKDSFKMGASGLKSKKFRLFMTILLSSIAFALFGLADTMASYNKVGNTIKSMKDSHITVATFEKESQRGKGLGSYYSSTRMDDEDIKFLSDKTGKEVLPVYFFDNYFNNSITSYFYTSNYSYMKHKTYATEIQGFVEMDSSNITQYGTLEGRAPIADNEIVITKYIADSFVEFGFRESYDTPNGNTSNINSPSDMINKNINFGGKTFKIVGILDTQFNVSRYSDLNNNNKYDLGTMVLESEFNDTVRYGVNAVGILNKGYFNRYVKDNYSSNTWVDSYFQCEYNRPSGVVNGSTNKLSKFNLNDNNVILFDSSKNTLADNEVIISLSESEIYFDTSSLHSSFNDIYEEYTSYDWFEYNPNKVGLLDYYYTNVKDKNNYATKYPNINQYCNNHDYPMESLLSAYSYVESDLTINLLNEPWAREDYYIEIKNNNSLKEEFETFINTELEDFPCEYTLYRDFIKDYGVENIVNSYMAYLNERGLASEDFSINSYLYSRNGSSFSSSLTFEKTKYFIEKLCRSFNLYDDNIRIYTYNGDIDSNYKIVGIYVKDYFEGSTYLMSNSLFEEVKDRVDPDQYKPYRYAIYKLNGESDIKKAVSITYNNKISKNSIGNNVAYRMRNSVMSNFTMVNSVIEVLANVFLYVGIVFAVFAALLLMNFISISISYKKREIGILRAIGARGFDVFKIFFNEAFIIAVINFIISLILAFIVCMIINNSLKSETGLLITLLNVGIRQVGLMLAISVLVAVLASALPVSRIARKKPIDAIRNSTN